MKILKTANYKKLSKTKIEEQLSMGIEVEKEHTDDVEVAGKIAVDHLQEDPEYYTKLKKMENTSKPKLILKDKKGK